MKSIQVDEQVATHLAALAALKGLSLSAYLSELAGMQDASHAQRLSWEQFDQELEQLSFDGPSLPDDFSRADIYANHD